MEVVLDEKTAKLIAEACNQLRLALEQAIYNYVKSESAEQEFLRALYLIGQVAGPKQGNSLLKKACEDIQKILTQDDPAKADRPKLPEDDE